MSRASTSEIFSRRDSDYVSFEIHAHDLSDISISKDREVVDSALHTFGKIWGKSRAFDLDSALDGKSIKNIKEEFVLSVVDSFFREDGEAIFSSMKRSLDANLLSVLDEYIDVRGAELRRMIEDKEVLLTGIREYRLLYKKLFRAFPGATFYATSLPSRDYFWRGEDSHSESVEASTREFIRHGGKIERIFFISGTEVNAGDEAKILSTHRNFGVKVFHIPRALVPPEEHKLFLADSGGRVAAEAFLQDDAISQLRLTFDKDSVRQYLHIFNLLRGSRDLRELGQADSA